MMHFKIPLLALMAYTHEHSFALDNAKAITFNPSGNCTTTGDGSRPSFHIPLEGETYLPNCQNPLRREFWRIFVKEDGTAYMSPRPDGLGIPLGICDFSDGHLIAHMAKLYGLCNDPVTDQVDPNIINSMEPLYALEFSTIFHRQLHFDVDTFLNTPWMVPDEDILSVCDLLGDAMRGDTKSFCKDIEERCDDQGNCNKRLYYPTREAAIDIVASLNDLYDVKKEGDVCDPTVWGATFGCPVAKCMEPQEGCMYTIAFDINFRNDCCQKLCYFVDSDGEECNFTTRTPTRSAANIRVGPSYVSLIISSALLLSFLKNNFYTKY